jgi:hypothetical protein
MSGGGRAPDWAVAFLAAHFVATSRRHTLRQLDEASFRRIARGCNNFIAWTTLPAFAGAFTFLPHPTGVYLVLGASLWGLLILFVVGRRVALERRRRKRLES